jgi:mono/diheme cytochrome c family protein
MKYCHQCHPRGEAGIGPALNNKPLPGFLIRFQIRSGLGAMPAFPERVVGNEELDVLVAYLKGVAPWRLNVTQYIDTQGLFPAPAPARK